MPHSQVLALTQFINFSPSQGVIGDCHTFDALKQQLLHDSLHFQHFPHRVLINLIAFLFLFFRYLPEAAALSCV